MNYYNFINRIFTEEIEKLSKIQDEFEAADVLVDDFFIALAEKQFELYQAMQQANINNDTKKRDEIVKEAQTFNSETRKRIDELSFKNLNKRYL